jgi:hypothetical protein
MADPGTAQAPAERSIRGYLRETPRIAGGDHTLCGMVTRSARSAAWSRVPCARRHERASRASGGMCGCASELLGFSEIALAEGSCERVADDGGRVASVVDAFGGFDAVEELLVPDGVGEVGERFGDPQASAGRDRGAAAVQASIQASAAARRRSAGR